MQNKINKISFSKSSIQFREEPFKITTSQTIIDPLLKQKPFTTNTQIKNHLQTSELTSEYNPITQMKTDSPDKKSFQTLTEKQIIKQLKCLIAKQQQEINKLIAQVQKLKRQRESDIDLINKNKSIAFSNLQSSQSLQNGFHQKQSFSKHSSNHLSVVHSKNSINRQFQHTENIQIQAFLKGFQKQIKDFTIKVLQPFHQNYIHAGQKYTNFKEKEDSLKFQENLKYTNYESLSLFSHFFPTLLKQTKTILKQVNQAIEQKSQENQNLKKKIKEQDKTLKQMMKEYEKNIIDSQKMQTKLLEEINRLKNYHDQLYEQHFGSSKHSYKANFYQ